jgi:hypothetical protein
VERAAPATGPLISIVTPCLNRVRFVAAAVESVLQQGYERFEHIITDGGSTDGTLDVLRKYPHLRVYSEPDKNLYDAVNKGIRRTRGDVIGFLNTDDCYAPGAFNRVATAFAAAPELDVVSGGAVVVEDGPDGSQRELARYCHPSDLALTVEQLATAQSLINARFFHRRVYERFGLYDIRFRIAADLEFLLRLVPARLKAAEVPEVVLCYRQHAGSLTFQGGGIPPRATDDVFQITEEWLNGSSLTGKERRALLRMHGTHALGSAYYCWRRGWYLSGARFACRGLMRNPFWLIWVMQAARNVARRAVGGVFARR